MKAAQPSSVARFYFPGSVSSCPVVSRKGSKIVIDKEVKKRKLLQEPKLILRLGKRIQQRVQPQTVAPKQSQYFASSVLPLHQGDSTIDVSFRKVDRTTFLDDDVKIVIDKEVKERKLLQRPKLILRLGKRIQQRVPTSTLAHKQKQHLSCSALLHTKMENNLELEPFKCDFNKCAAIIFKNNMRNTYLCSLRCLDSRHPGQLRRVILDHAQLQTNSDKMVSELSAMLATMLADDQLDNDTKIKNYDSFKSRIKGLLEEVEKTKTVEVQSSSDSSDSTRSLP